MVEMNRDDLEKLLQKLSEGAVEYKSVVNQLSSLLEPSDEEKTANVSASNLCLDLDRKQRCGFPEAIYAPGKKPELILEAFTALHQNGDHALATRVCAEQIELVCANFSEVVLNEEARTLRLMAKESKQTETQSSRQPCILTAGSTDRPVAEEAAETLRWMGYDPVLFFDAGVAGPQRLLKHVERLQQADVIIVVAGMEGALPSVVGGWVSCPVIAVPTSVGYGASFGGVSALLSMLNSCAANVCTVNIDAGFKAGYLAGLMTWRIDEASSPEQAKRSPGKA